jgi:hypothetical protein
LRLVLATNRFAEIGGSETYLLTVAEQLMRLGHGVTIYATELGKMAELARERGVEVAAEEDDLPAACDVALTQDGAWRMILRPDGHRRRNFSSATARSLTSRCRRSFPAW